MLTNCSSYLEFETIVVKSISICGVSWNRRSKYDKIPANVDILITHEPPTGILDAGSKFGIERHFGCEYLCAVFTKLDFRAPRFHLFGHIHEGFGA